ncbi:MAG: hypothetical protein KAV00_18565 [Phycisphaerae bacterium]|nr:hypothetical protein [Phycisphaerae bacterium]
MAKQYEKLTGTGPTVKIEIVEVTGKKMVRRQENRFASKADIQGDLVTLNTQKADIEKRIVATEALLLEME